METIMIVDDEAINRMVVQKTLAKEGYSVVEAKDGNTALDLIGEETPDLILLDIMMPGISGYDVCSQLKENPETGTIPIIMLTALSGREDIEKGVTAGADEFITKPFNHDELLVRIHTLLQIKNLNEYFHENQLFFEKVHTLTDTIVEEYPIDGKDIENLVLSVFEINLKGHAGEKNKPVGVFYSFISDGIKIPETYITKEKGSVFRRSRAFSFNSDALAPLCNNQKGLLVSTWRNTAKSIEEYQEKLPKVLTETVGTVRNFLYYEDDEQKVMFINFDQEISTFSLTWYSHLIHYSKTIASILDRMRRKELEYTALANALSHIAEIKDDATGKHIRVRELCRIICKELECSKGFTVQIIDAIGLYDMGKLLVDHTILVKKKPLTDREWDLIRKVPEYVNSILSDLPRFSIVKEIATGIYEHWDGSGYPNGRKGEEIPLSARIVALANVYDALRSSKSYRTAFTHEEASQIINEGDERVKPSYFDPKILKIFNDRSPDIASLYQDQFSL